MNPFLLKPEKIETTLENWSQLYPGALDARAVDPRTRMWLILLSGAEFEAVGFSHRLHRHSDNNDLRRELALTRRIEQQQQKKISCLKPVGENLLEHTIGYEQLAVELTAHMARCESDEYVKLALDFALLEDFDHLYRYSDLLELEQGVRAETLVGSYTEIMPARPTAAHHRHPFDSVLWPIRTGRAAPLTRLHVAIITAAEQQTMNYYMNTAAFHPTELGRRLYQEIAMVEEQHVTHYGSLLDPTVSPLQALVEHEYAECYLYYSAMADDCGGLRLLWERCLMQEVAHLHRAAQLMERYEGRCWQQVMGSGEFPPPISLAGNKEYVRSVLASTAQLTAQREKYAPICDVPPDADFFRYQRTVQPTDAMIASHRVIREIIAQRGGDYRLEDGPSPLCALRPRDRDNVTLGRCCTGGGEPCK